MKDDILKLEESLWIEETRFNKEYLDKVLHKDFMEFGKSGRVYRKNDILNDLEGKIHTLFPFKNLQIRRIELNSFLVTYQVEIRENNTIILTNRSSIWLKVDQDMQMIFHQGTVINK